MKITIKCITEKTTGVPELETARIVVRELNLPITPEECNDLFEQSKGPRISILMPGVERLIRHLHSQGIPMAIATGSNRESYAWKSEPHPELFSIFSHVLNVPDDPEVTRGKPDPQPFLVCASRFVSPPADMSNVIVFEDAIAGVQAANAAGMRSVWVPDPRTPKNIGGNVIPFKRLKSLEYFDPKEFGIAPF